MINKLKITAISAVCLLIPHWVSAVELFGDFRYRYEIIDDESKTYERHRNRLRARIGLKSQIHKQMDVRLVLASGNEDPLSADFTLDGEFLDSDARFDEACFIWKPTGNFTLIGGKMKTPFYKTVGSKLLWAGDLRPEGLILQYENNWFFSKAGIFFLEEREKDDDSSIFAGQIGYKGKMANNIKMTVGVGYFDYSNVQNWKLSSFDWLDKKGSSYGNTLDSNGKFINDYNELEIFADVTYLGIGIPITLYVDYVMNTAVEDTVADDNDTGYLIGLKIGKAKAPDSWEFGYDYRRLESDAVFGLFADSDFIGSGTNGKGHGFDITYQVAKNWQFRIAGLMNEKYLDRESKDYNRIKFNVYFKF